MIWRKMGLSSVNLKILTLIC